MEKHDDLSRTNMLVLTDDDLFVVRGGGILIAGNFCGNNCGTTCGNECGFFCGNDCQGTIS